MTFEPFIEVVSRLKMQLWELDISALQISFRPALSEGPTEFLAWQETIHTQDRDFVVNAILDTISEKRPGFDCQMRIQSRDGRWCVYRMRGAPVRNDKGKFSCLSGIIEDFSQYDHRLTDLQRQIGRMENQAREKNDFFASITHELRTPMSGVIGLADLVLDSEDLGADNRSLVESIRQCAHSLISLVNDTLDLSKLEARKIELIHEYFDVRMLVHDIEALFWGKFIQKDLNFLAVVDEDVPRMIHSDANRLQQVLVNLIGNAQKFTPEGGGICLRVELLNAFEGSVNLLFSVIDSGVGIKQENQGRIFDEYTQESANTAQKFGGTGLGLSIARELVTLFGGELKVRSEPGRGTVFQFSMQVATQRSELDEPLVSREIVRVAGKRALRILLAEDNLVNQKVASRILEKNGHQVVIAQNGKEAVDLQQLDSFDLILMDIQMPIMSGEQATRTIRDREVAQQLKPIPIIALTAHAMSGDREKYIALGMDDYVSKPIDREVLMKAIWDAVDR